MVGAVSVPVQLAWVPSGSAFAPTKSIFGSIWVAPVTVFVRSTPCWLGAAFGGANAPLGTATPCTSRPTAKVMFPAARESLAAAHPMD